MDDPTYRPTYELDNDVVKNGWNPTQVRLYGLLPKVDLSIIIKTFSGKVEKTSASAAAPLPILVDSALRVSTEQGFALIAAHNPETEKPLQIGIIFGYAYEGGYYDLPKPKIMIIPAPARPVTADDSGYDKKKDYVLWVVDKLEVCVEVEINQGFVEQLVLEANLPGRRSPTTYRAQGRLAHRNGRLTE